MSNNRIITAISGPIESDTVDNTQFDVSFEQNEYIDMQYTIASEPSALNDPVVWGLQLLRVTPGAVMSILSCGIITPAGIVHGSFSPDISIRWVTLPKSEDSVRQKVYETKVPFIPIEYQTGTDIFIPRDIEVLGENADAVQLQAAFKGTLASLNLPDEYNGNSIPVYAFMKIQIDDRMVKP